MPSSRQPRSPPEVPWALRRDVFVAASRPPQGIDAPEFGVRLSPELSSAVAEHGGLPRVLDVMRRERELGLAHAAEQIIAQHKGLVDHQVRNYSHRGDPADLSQVGLAGLLDAAEWFDYRKGVKFSTFASNNIRGHILHYLRDRDGSAARTVVKRGAEIDAAVRALSRELGRPPDSDELAKHLGVDAQTITNFYAARAIANAESLEGLTDETRPSGSEPSVPSHADAVLARVGLEQALSALEPRERKVIDGLFFKEKTLRQISEELGLSLTTVTKARGTAFRKLRKALEPR